eukprot:GHUV01007717.1.p1 GENE.GHUV01007717.1~~GHUV01007717.1.p1  ORF type:complete len:340 (+),score=19.49 GHUV01007717.1:20-1039(+)
MREHRPGNCAASVVFDSYIICCWSLTAFRVLPSTSDMLLRPKLPGTHRPCIARSKTSRRYQNVTATASVQVADAQTYAWAGSDEFSSLDDRKDLPPLPLPPIQTRKRIVLVRHGQSTWNAEGRIQGSSNFSGLTAKGTAQAETTRDMLSGDNFESLYVSPLTRATQTADIITQGRQLTTKTLPVLREIDLYSFQGLLKSEGKSRFGDEYIMWQKQAEAFTIDQHAPVRELWYRASLAWQEMLAAPERCALVVAHNAVNQALIGSALGLTARYFRRLLQVNALRKQLSISDALHFEIIADSSCEVRVCVSMHLPALDISTRPNAWTSTAQSESLLPLTIA